VVSRRRQFDRLNGSAILGNHVRDKGAFFHEHFIGRGDL
jgi:hypothetical protein